MFNKTALKHVFPLVKMGWIWINLPIINQKRLTFSRFLLKIPLARAKIACRKVTVQFLHLWRYEKETKCFIKSSLRKVATQLNICCFTFSPPWGVNKEAKKVFCLRLIRAPSRHTYLITNYTATSDTLI